LFSPTDGFIACSFSIAAKILARRRFLGVTLLEQLVSALS
jgi:hypothetical protein